MKKQNLVVVAVQLKRAKTKSLVEFRLDRGMNYSEALATVSKQMPGWKVISCMTTHDR